RRAFRVRSSRWGRGSLWVRRWMVWVMAWAKRPAGMARMSRLGTAEMSHRRSFHVAGAVMRAVLGLVMRLWGRGRWAAMVGAGRGREALRMGPWGGRWPRVRRWLLAMVRRMVPVRMTKGRPIHTRVRMAEAITRGSRRKAAMFWKIRRQR